MQNPKNQPKISKSYQNRPRPYHFGGGSALCCSGPLLQGTVIAASAGIGFGLTHFLAHNRVHYFLWLFVRVSQVYKVAKLKRLALV